MNKYQNKKVRWNDITFASKNECRRYIVLKNMQRVGLITSLTLQPVFILQDKFKKNGKTIIAIKYVADFSYYLEGKRVIEDVKGYETDVFKLKHKLFENKFPELTLTLVK